MNICQVCGRDRGWDKGKRCGHCGPDARYFEPRVEATDCRSCGSADVACVERAAAEGYKCCPSCAHDQPAASAPPLVRPEAVHDAFYKLAVQQRDAAWAELEALKQQQPVVRHVTREMANRIYFVAMRATTGERESAELLKVVAAIEAQVAADDAREDTDA